MKFIVDAQLPRRLADWLVTQAMMPSTRLISLKEIARPISRS